MDTKCSCYTEKQHEKVTRTLFLTELSCRREHHHISLLVWFSRFFHVVLANKIKTTPTAEAQSVHIKNINVIDGLYCCGRMFLRSLGGARGHSTLWPVESRSTVHSAKTAILCRGRTLCQTEKQHVEGYRNHMLNLEKVCSMSCKQP